MNGFIAVQITMNCLNQSITSVLQVAERIETTAKNYQEKDKIIESKDKEIKKLTKDLETTQKSGDALTADLAATSASLELKQVSCMYNLLHVP